MDTFDEPARDAGCSEFARFIRQISVCPIESFQMSSHENLEVVLFVTYDQVLQQLPLKIRQSMESMRDIVKAHVAIVSKGDNFWEAGDKCVKSLQGTIHPIKQQNSRVFIGSASFSADDVIAIEGGKMVILDDLLATLVSNDVASEQCFDQGSFDGPYMIPSPCPRNLIDMDATRPSGFSLYSILFDAQDKSIKLWASTSATSKMKLCSMFDKKLELIHVLVRNEDQKIIASARHPIPIVIRKSLNTMSDFGKETLKKWGYDDIYGLDAPLNVPEHVLLKSDHNPVVTESNVDQDSEEEKRWTLNPSRGPSYGGQDVWIYFDTSKMVSSLFSSQSDCPDVYFGDRIASQIRWIGPGFIECKTPEYSQGHLGNLTTVDEWEWATVVTIVTKEGAVIRRLSYSYYSCYYVWDENDPESSDKGKPVEFCDNNKENPYAVYAIYDAHHHPLFRKWKDLKWRIELAHIMQHLSSLFNQAQLDQLSNTLNRALDFSSPPESNSNIAPSVAPLFSLLAHTPNKFTMWTILHYATLVSDENYFRIILSKTFPLVRVCDSDGHSALEIALRRGCVTKAELLYYAAHTRDFSWQTAWNAFSSQVLGSHAM